MGSSPCRRLSLLGFAHPVVGPPLSGTGQVQTADPHSGPHIRRKSDYDFNIYFVNIYVL